MASLWCLSAATAAFFSPSPVVKNSNGAVTVSPTNSCISLRSRPCALQRRRRDLTVCLVWDQEEEQHTYRHPLDFPYVDRPKPPARTNVFPQLPPIPTPLTTWLPHDVAPDDEIDEDEEEYEEEQEQEYVEEPDF
ncbi:uncharacterized protein LOC144545954 isoform X2 [Carex rostrata]